ncbi:uncharacterized protein LOC134296189 [Anolis carolinensis]|uniref:uncharacterized protein LOC134296189 n=1 Tax=Anolis carolinensis TaxID=28377 RepID=UPI002F2B2EBC
MAGVKQKNDRDLRDGRGIGIGRRPSQAEEVNLKDILRENQKLAEQQAEFQKESELKLDKQSLQQREMCQELIEMKKEIKEEIGFLKKEMARTYKDINDLKSENLKLSKSHNKLQKKVDGLEKKNIKLEKLQEKLEINEKESQLRFRNIQEESGENIRKIVIKLIADTLQKEEEFIESEVDKVYRIQTNFSRRNRATRDTIVHFVKKKIRDDVLINNNRNPIYFKDKKIIVLKEFSQTILNTRRKYFFLTDELKRQKIRFRWERNEGIMAMWYGEKYWLTSEDKAKDFYQKLMKERKTNPPETTPPSSVKRKKPKRARLRSPKDIKGSKGDIPITTSDPSDVGDDDEEEESMVEEVDLVTEDEGKMERGEDQRKEKGEEEATYG